MRALPETTEAYHRKHSGLHTSLLGRTGLVVSGAGFGGYRVSVGVEGHRQALRSALTSGINLIDTSANYADGGSEELIGETLVELIREGSIARSEVVVVTKGGYIQGSNYTMARERSEAGSGFQDVVEYAAGLWHSISPEFLHDQITRSLNRLGLRTIDVYLLHNPEYYLGWAAKHQVPVEEARQEYYRRIRAAFQHLETEVEEGRIAWYGTSSNSFPEERAASDFTSLEEVVKIAETIALTHHFAVIQFPANLVEKGFVTERNQSEERTLIELAREKNLGVLINRPLNVIADDRLIRMADFPLGEVAASDDEIVGQIGRLIETEKGFMSEHLDDFSGDPEGRRAIEEFLSVGLTLDRYWTTFGSIEQYNDILSQHFSPRLGYLSQYFRKHGDDRHVDWYARYLADARALLHSVSTYYSREAAARSQCIRERIAGALGSKPDGTLSSLSIRLLLGVEGVDAVLVGMRRGEYVADALEALRHGPLGDESFWRKLDLGDCLAEPDEEDDE
jgi:aryl-alcohol dehydrogenase-like predicted oxidoreductase